MSPNLRPFRVAAVVALAAAALPLGASAMAAKSPSRTEQLLSAAGFDAVPANTPGRQAELASLPRHRLIAQPNGGSFTYVYADPSGCDCLYLGDADNYQEYQRLALKQRLAQQKADAADAYRFGSLNWDLWGPYAGWAWQGPIFVHYGDHFGHGSGGHMGGSRGGGHH